MAKVMRPISNRKLHCCLLALILSILIFLSLPLLLIYLANTRYEEWQNQQSETKFSTSLIMDKLKVPVSGSENIKGTTSKNDTPTNEFEGNDLALPNSIGSDRFPIINCTQIALDANLSMADENLHCPTGSFPCQSCPEVCVEQRRICDGIADCPDRSDESSCHDSSGAMKIIFQNIVNIAAKKKQSASGSGAKVTLAKPDSCEIVEFMQEKCPCVWTESRVIICERLGLTSVPNTLNESVYKIRMSNNSITNIDNVVWPKSLSSLVLVNNRITHIGQTTFKSAPNLSKLYLSHNEISHIDSESFAGLSGLTSLQIEANKLTSFDSRMLRHTPLIRLLLLGENMIELPEETRFGICRDLKELHLDHNQISIIRKHYFSNMTSLFWLSLTYNKISYIEDGSFNWDYELEELNLSFNRIKTINRLTFSHSLNIQRLHLSGNSELKTLPMDAFREIMSLRSLNLTDIDFNYLERETFAYLKQLEYIYFKKFRYCHYATHVRVCRPLTDGLSSVTELLAFPILKYAVWIVASVCSLGNIFVFLWRSISPHEDRTLSLFVRNLSIADLMMGIYLGAIGWQDWKFQHNFGQYAIEWMSSKTCTAIGFLAILSSELSVFILTIITIERYRSIISIKRFEEETQKRRARLYVALAWFFSFLIAFYPLVEWLMRSSDSYATNGLCLPLHIDQPFTPGWQYSAFIYLGINFSAVMIIIALYVHMYSMIMDGRQATRPVLFKAEKREDAILAIRFFFIVITDCLCWIPIVVIKVMALSNVSISSSIYGWLVVFIIPINSALNPIVYTLAAPTSLRANIFRLFERLCYKIDLLTANGTSNYSSQSSESENCQTLVGRRRNIHGSNSTTCDTFDPSVASNPKASLDSAPIINHNALIVPETPTETAKLVRESLNESRTASRSIDSTREEFNRRHSNGNTDIEIDANYDDDCGHDENQIHGQQFYPRHYHMTTVLDGNWKSAQYDCVSTYGDNAIEQEIISNQTANLTGANERLANNCCESRKRLPMYDQIDRRRSLDAKGQSANKRQWNNCIEQFTSTSGEQSPVRGRKSFIRTLRMQTSVSSGTAGTETSIGSDTCGEIALNRIGSSSVGREVEKTDNLQSDNLALVSSPYQRPITVRDNIDTDSVETRQPVTGRQCRVSFSSKDSRTCLLSQNDLC